MQEIREQEGVAENGLVAVLSTLEMGMSYRMFRRRDNDFAVLKRAPRKCKHDYFCDLKHRAEGVRIKHRAGKNTVKMYNKEPTRLRVETTLNDGQGLKVDRTKQDEPDGKPQWLALRKTVVDLPRRARLSQSANERYLEALSTITADTPLSELTDKLCQRVEVNGRRHRGLRPFDPEDVQLLQAVSRGEFFISGFRNRDVRKSLYGDTKVEETVAGGGDPAQRRLGRGADRAAGLPRPPCPPGNPCSPGHRRPGRESVCRPSRVSNRPG